MASADDAVLTLVEREPDAVVAVDDQLRITQWNGAAERVFGRQRDDMLGQPLQDFLSSCRWTHARAVLDLLRQGTPVPAYDTSWEGPNGESIALRIHPVGAYHHGRFAGAAAVLHILDATQAMPGSWDHLLQELPLVTALFDRTGTVVLSAGGNYRAVVGVGVGLLDVAPPRSAMHAAVTSALSGGVSDFQMSFDDRDWQCRVAPLEQPAPEAQAAVGSLCAYDITDVARASGRLSDVLQAAPLCLVSFDLNAHVTYAAGSGFAALDIDPSRTLGKNMIAMYGDNLDIRDGILACLDGTAVDLVTQYGGRVWDLHYRPCNSATGEVTGGIVIAQDATGWIARTAPTGQAAARPVELGVTPLVGFLERDEVTGLLGRRGLRRRLAEPIPTGHTRAVAVLSVEGFDTINDGTALRGHALRAFGTQLRARAGGADVGRWHGDEFIVVLDHDRAAQALQDLCRELVELARHALPVGEQLLHLTVHAGLTSSELTPYRDLPDAARQALHTARLPGHDQLAWFVPGQDTPAPSPQLLTRQLHDAVSDNQLVLHYQPVVALGSSEVVGVEALVRWMHPDQGLLPPERFIPFAERMGLMVPLGSWVLHAACAAAAQITAAGSGLRTVAVNLSAEQLNHPGLVEQVEIALQSSGCPPGRLVLEVTETAVMTDLGSAVRTLQTLKDLGIGLSLDDFGTGYSSLLYLKHFPVDSLKIDRSFISGLGINTDDSAIVASTISLTKTLGISCIAEGIETMDQHALLRDLDCDLGQGYLFSRPQPLAPLLPWLAERSTEARQSPRDLTQDEAEPVVTQILAMHRQAASLLTIAASLNHHGHRTARGTRWSAKAVARVIANTQYPQLRLP